MPMGWALQCNRLCLGVLATILFVPSMPASAAESICSRADVLYCDDFENRAIGQTVGGGVSVSDYTSFGGGVSNIGIAGTSSQREMQLELKPGKRDTIYPQWGISPQQNAVYARWYAKWSPGFIWNSCSNKHFYFLAKDGSGIVWRVALLMKRLSGQPSAAEPVLESYCTQTDNPDSTCSGGEMFYHQNVGTPITIVPNHTYRFEVMVKPDTFGDAFSGELKLWIDGVLKTSFSNVSLRKATSNTPINAVWFTSYYGCVAETSPQDQFIYYDNIVVSTSPIDQPVMRPPLNLRIP